MKEDEEEKNGRNVVERFGKEFDKDSQRIEEGVKTTDCWLRSRQQSKSLPAGRLVSFTGFRLLPLHD